MTITGITLGGSSIELTLWGETAVNFNDTDKILAVRGAKLNLLQGRGHGQKAFTAKTDPEIA